MKKILSLILALMLGVVSLPGMAEQEELGVIGGADGPTSVFVSKSGFVLPDEWGQKALDAGYRCVSDLRITEMAGINTGNASIDAAITELIKALGFRIEMQGDENHMAFSISDKDVLTLGTAVNGDDAYLNSNLLGGTIVVGKDEISPMINRLLEMLVMMDVFTEDDAAALKEQAGWLVDTLAVAFEHGPYSVKLTEADLLTLDYSALKTVLAELAEKCEIIENPVVPRSCDMAVSGVKLTVSNDEFVDMIQAALEFVKDNPKLMDFIAAQAGLFTEGQLNAVWAVYDQYGMFETEDEFRADGNVSIEQQINEAIAELDNKKLLDGDYVATIYVDEAMMPVYAALSMPVFIEQENLYSMEDAQHDIVKGETVNVELTYTRQTVAQGVSHVVNINVDEEPLTVDVLVNGNHAHIVLSVPDEAPVTIDASVEDNQLIAAFSYVPDEVHAYSGTLKGSYLYNETDYELILELDGVHEYTPAVVETPALNGMTLPGFAKKTPQPKTDKVALGMKADYQLDGVAYNGQSTLKLCYNDIIVGVTVDAFSTDPVESILSGTVVRPAELDDAAFANWFVSIVNSLSSWAANLMTALPESFMTMIEEASMF